MHASHGCITHLLDLCGGFTLQSRQPDSWEGWYWGAKHIWGMDPLGQQNKQNNVIKDISENGDAVLFWGCDPETTPLGWGGYMASRICFWFTEIGVKQIHISPDVNYANAVHADKWIPVLPNTDAALQLAIAYTWIKDGTFDQEYLDTHAVGFENFKYYVLGGEDGVPKTPEVGRKDLRRAFLHHQGARPLLGQARSLHRALQRRLVHPLMLRARTGASRSGTSGHAGSRKAWR